MSTFFRVATLWEILNCSTIETVHTSLEEAEDDRRSHVEQFELQIPSAHCQVCAGIVGHLRERREGGREGGREVMEGRRRENGDGLRG